MIPEFLVDIQRLMRSIESILKSDDTKIYAYLLFDQLNYTSEWLHQEQTQKAVILRTQ